MPRAATLLLLVPSLLLAACARDTWERPAFVYARSGELQQFKRYERYPMRDFRHHFRRQVYYRVQEERPEWQGDQTTLVEQLGFPDYVRKPFASFQDEKVEEWLYVDRQELYQFIGGMTVYEGPLTDVETTFLRYGYPDAARTSIETPGPVRIAMSYRNMFGPGRIESFNFMNDALVSGVEGN